jgi:hypothetical protein
MAAPVPDAAVIRLLSFRSNAVDVDFDTLVVEVAGIGGADGGFFVNAAGCRSHPIATAKCSRQDNFVS